MKSTGCLELPAASEGGAPPAMVEAHSIKAGGVFNLAKAGRAEI